jgi:hypothetical protein
MDEDWMTEEAMRLDGRTVVVTGANRGLASRVGGPRRARVAFRRLDLTSLESMPE